MVSPQPGSSRVRERAPPGGRSGVWPWRPGARKTDGVCSTDLWGERRVFIRPWASAASLGDPSAGGPGPGGDDCRRRPGRREGKAPSPLRDPDRNLLAGPLGNRLFPTAGDAPGKAVTKRSLLESAGACTGENHEVRMAGSTPMGAPPRRVAALGPSVPVIARGGDGIDRPRNARGGPK